MGRKRIITYVPEDKIRIRKEGALPLVMDLGNKFNSLGGMISFFTSSFLLSLRTFFSTKKKINEIRAKYEKTLDLNTQKS